MALHPDTAQPRTAAPGAGRHLRLMRVRKAGVPLLAMLLAAICLLAAAAPVWAQQPSPTADTHIYLPVVRHDGAIAEVTSPDGKVVLRVRLTDARNRVGTLRFDVLYDGREVVRDGRLGVDLQSSAVAASSVDEDVQGFAPLLVAGTHFDWLGTAERVVRSSFTMPIAERATIPDAFDEVTIDLRARGGAPVLHLQVIARAYNEGIALRYRVPGQPGVASVRIAAEHTSFTFTQNHTLWAQDSSINPAHPHENEHKPVMLTAAPAAIENPVTMRHTDDFYMVLTEAVVDDYPAMRLEHTATTLRVALRSTATGFALPFTSPWRVLMLAPTAGDLIEQNYLMYNLAAPSRIGNPAWLKPGKAMRVMYALGQPGSGSEAQTNALALIDFAATHGIEYIEFDAGWYGPEDNAAYSPTRPIPGLDIPKIAEEAAKKNLGVVLYVNYTQLQRDVDSIMGLFEFWGIKGIKLGFVDGTSQRGIKEVHYTVQKAAEYGMFVDIHDNYCPSGMSRTYPNLFTQECVRGNEHYPGAEHNATLPFTRLLLGAADYTIPYFGDLKNVSRAHQMALSVIIYSPLKFLFWYDVPSSYDAGADEEIVFFRNLPSTWDETRVLHAAIGDYVSIARRKGSAWFVGTITDGSARTLELALDFLPPGEEYTAHLFTDEGRALVGVDAISVTSASMITATLPAAGGHAVWLEPVGQ